MEENNLSPLKKLGRFLEIYDWVWSIPLSIFVYWGFGFFFGAVMGMSVGTFDLSFVQPLFLAVTVVTGASVASIYILRFHWKALYRFIYSSKLTDPNLSSVASFRMLQPWQKILVTSLFYFIFFVAVVAVYLRIL